MLFNQPGSPGPPTCQVGWDWEMLGEQRGEQRGEQGAGEGDFRDHASEASPACRKQSLGGWVG